MSVAINSTRKTVEISWDPDANPTEPPTETDPPVPTHPIYLPPYVDIGGPGDQPYPDQGLPGDQPHPDQGLPGDQPRPSHPIFLPPYIDNSLPLPQPRPDQGLPGDQPYPDQGLPGSQPHPDQGLPGDQPYPDNTLPEFPPDVVEGIDPDKLEALKEFLLGNLPPFTGAPEYPRPVSSEDIEAVQVFAQGQDGDWSNTAVMPNDGLAALAYPTDFKGESYVEVRKLDGTLVDSGTISVK